MNAAQYFKHVRSLGAFTAQDCLELARQAAELDRSAELRNVARPGVVWYESLHDGSDKCKFSNGITVY